MSEQASATKGPSDFSLVLGGPLFQFLTHVGLARPEMDRAKRRMNSFEVVRGMGLLPFDKNVVIRLAIMLALPLSPLILTMIPLKELRSRLLKVFV